MNAYLWRLSLLYKDSYEIILALFISNDKEGTYMATNYRNK